MTKVSDNTYKYQPLIGGPKVNHPLTWKENYQLYMSNRKQKRNQAANRFTPFTVYGVFFIALTSSLMVWWAFPWISVVGAAALTGSATVAHLIMFMRGNRKATKTFLGSGMYQDLDDELRCQFAKNYVDQNLLKSQLKNLPVLNMLWKKTVKNYCLENNLTAKTLTSTHKHKIRELFRNKAAKQIARRHQFYLKYNADLQMIDDEWAKILIDYNDFFDKNKFSSHSSFLGIPKSWWLTLASLGALTSGIAFFLTIAAECIEFFAIASLATPAASFILISAAIVGVMQGLLFYSSLKGFITNGFGELWNKIKPNMLTDENNQPQYFATVAKNLIKYSLMILIVPVSVLSIILFQSTILNSANTILELSFNLFEGFSWAANGQLIMNATIQTLMYGILLPTNILFTLKHSLGSCNHLANSIMKSSETFNSTALVDAFFRPHRVIFYGLAYSLIFGTLLVHTLSEAFVMMAGNETFNPVDRISRLFVSTCNLFGINATKTAVTMATGQDLAVHGHFVCVNGNKLVQWFDNSATPDQSIDESELEKIEILATSNVTSDEVPALQM